MHYSLDGQNIKAYRHEPNISLQFARLFLNKFQLSPAQLTTSIKISYSIYPFIQRQMSKSMNYFPEPTPRDVGETDRRSISRRGGSERRAGREGGQQEGPEVRLSLWEF